MTYVATIIFVIINAKFRLVSACCISIDNQQLVSLHRNVFEECMFIKASQIVFESYYSLMYSLSKIKAIWQKHATSLKKTKRESNMISPETAMSFLFPSLSPSRKTERAVQNATSVRSTSPSLSLTSGWRHQIAAASATANTPRDKNKGNLFA